MSHLSLDNLAAPSDERALKREVSSLQGASRLKGGLTHRPSSGDGTIFEQPVEDRAIISNIV
jgi:hypothetical protein